MENNAKKQFTLTVDDQEVMIIGSALGKMPYETAAPLVAKLQQQIKEQVDATAPAPVPAEPEAEKA